MADVLREREMTEHDAILFLDLDGVLIPHTPNEPDDAIVRFSPSAISALNRITRESAARIVVSSMWRFFARWDELRAILTDAGVDGDVIDRLPLEFPEDDDPSCRGEEIAHWVRTHDFRGKLVVLDDEASVPPFEQFLVRPDPAVGLTTDDANMALRILRGTNAEPRRP